MEVTAGPENLGLEGTWFHRRGWSRGGAVFGYSTRAASLSPRTISVGSPRSVRVTRVTTIEPIVLRTASRVRITTGRLPAGEGSSAHQTSARLTHGRPSIRGGRGARPPERAESHRPLRQ